MVGACEATAMNLYGVPAAGISVLLGNYHNCTPRGGIAEEYVSLADVKGMVKLITATVMQIAGSGGKKKNRSAKAAMKARLEKGVRDHAKYDPRRK